MILRAPPCDAVQLRFPERGAHRCHHRTLVRYMVHKSAFNNMQGNDDCRSRGAPQGHTRIRGAAATRHARPAAEGLGPDRSMVPIAMGMLTVASDLSFPDALDLLRAHAFLTERTLDEIA